MNDKTDTPQDDCFRSTLAYSKYFFTFHKCASSLFAGYVLRNVDKLTHIDYARRLFSGQSDASNQLSFETQGYIYGPIRLSANPNGEVYQKLLIPTIDPNFISDKFAICMVRDPRDILVSLYYSAGFNHVLSPVGEIREWQLMHRRQIQQLSLDEYVLLNAKKQVIHFDKMLGLLNQCNNCVLVKYEDMIERFDYFIDRLSTFLPFSNEVIARIYKETRPRKEEDILAHRRSGKVGGFRMKLQTETVESLNVMLDRTLSEFGYEP